MTMPGQLTAKPPVSPHPNLAAAERAGTTKHGSAIWVLQCTCGQTIVADVPKIKKGWARCRECNPSYAELEAQRILSVLPATMNEIVERSGMTLQQVRYRLTVMKPAQCHVGKWRRPRGSGALQPIIVAGPGEDVPCNLEPRPEAEVKRRYRKRIRKAIDRALAGGREDPRYVNHISLRLANETAKRARVAPQTWLSALMGAA